MDLQFTLEFLKDLAANNHKEWMDDNKKRYLMAKDNVIELVADVLSEISHFDPALADLEPKKTLFRINRDIRFSKNKDPYKLNFGASIASGGRKSGNPGYYLNIQPNNTFVGGGLYQPSSDSLAKVRQEIDYNGAQLRKVIDNESFKKYYDAPYSEDKLKTAPRGYPKDHPDLELLQLKHYVFMRSISDDEVVGNNFPQKVAEAFKALHPFNLFLMEALS